MTHSLNAYARYLGASYHTKLVASTGFAIERPLLDAWSASQDLIVTRTAIGNVNIGFHELVQIFHANPHWISDAEVLDYMTTLPSLRTLADLNVVLHPPGVLGMVLHSPIESGMTRAELEEASEREYMPYRDFLRHDGGLDDHRASPLPLAHPDDLAEGVPCLMGLMWRTRATESLDRYVAARVAEIAFGSDDHHSVLRPLRDSGEVYSTISRYLFDIDVFIVGVIGTYSPSKYFRVLKVLHNLDNIGAVLDHAKATFSSRLRMSDSHIPLHRIGTYLTLDPDTNDDAILGLANQVSSDQILEIVMGRSFPLLKKVDGHGIQ